MMRGCSKPALADRVNLPVTSVNKTSRFQHFNGLVLMTSLVRPTEEIAEVSPFDKSSD
jgi:hypothetical protein